MVPVLDSNNVPLMPCSEKRARKMMEKDQAQAYWQKGIFCIRLSKEPSNRKYQEVVLGIDPGSKREGYTVITFKSVVLNITTTTPDWVKENVETRRTLRRTRRRRKTPYRKCRSNRCRNKAFLAPSTKARWQAKLRIIASLSKIAPITTIGVEDIKAVSRPGKEKWNTSFSPLEVGKAWFYDEVVKLGKLSLIITQGYQTKAHRDQRGFTKSKDKLSFVWEAHNVDSHALAEMALSTSVVPYFGLYRMDFLRHYRRQLHLQQPIKGGKRRRHGTTISMGMSRGSVLQSPKNGRLSYLGGSSRNRLSLHSIETGSRVNQKTKIEDVKRLYTQNRRVQFIPRLKTWASLNNFVSKPL